MKGKAVLMGMDCDGTKGISAKQEFNVTRYILEAVTFVAFVALSETSVL